VGSVAHPAGKEMKIMLFLKKWYKPALYYLVGILFLIGVSVVAVLLLDRSMYNPDSIQKALAFYQDSYWLLALNAVLLIMLGLIMAIIFNGLFIASGVLFVLVAGLAYANNLKIISRGEPIYPTDLEMIGNANALIKMVNVSQVLLLLVAAIAILAVLIVGEHFLKKICGIKKVTWKVYFIRWVVLIPLFWGVSQYLFVAKSDTVVASELGSHGLYNMEWNQTQNYTTNSFVMGFMYNASADPMTKPANYSAATIQKIVKKYAAAAKQTNASRKVIPKNLNVNIILSESLADLDTTDIQKNFSFSMDPQPFVNGIQSDDNAKTASGVMVSPEYGGGTANVEYEVLTGFSESFLLSSPYQTVVPKKTTFPSIANDLLQDGYTTSAFHSYYSNMYKRGTNYPKLGIKKFLSIDQLKGLKQSPYGSYTTDESLFANLYNQWHTLSGKPQFNMTITMQNHMPYTTRQANVQPKISVEMKDQEKKPKAADYDMKQLQNYANSVKISDDTLQKMYDRIQKQKQPTIVLVFGDHRPGQVFDFLRKRNVVQGHTTPYFILANFDLKEQNLPEVSPNQLVPVLFQSTQYQISPFYAMMDELRGQLPVITKFARLDSADKKDADYKTTQAYKEYRLINYDVTYGKNYAASDGFYKVP
jgi:phosphoglycerol transferase MdoB-like AlkP superfamily enzyme